MGERTEAGPGARRSSGTAAERLHRLLWILPRASREEGATWEELSAELGVGPDVVRSDVVTLTERAYRLPPGLGDDIQVGFEADRLTIWTKGEFRRPPRLGPREALALELALRCRPPSPGEASPEGGGDEGADTSGPARRLLAALSGVDPDAVGTERLLVDFGRGEMAGPGALLFEAARERFPVRIRYLKDGADAPEPRTLHPWTMLRAEGHWYAVGRDPLAEGAVEGVEGLRVFRLDRVLSAERLEGDAWEAPPEGFDPEALLDGRRLFVGHGGGPARVRYAPEVARWILEWVEERWPEEAEVEEDGEGGVVLEHPVEDARWLVRHVLSLAGAAEVLEPAELRAAVREGAERVA